MIIRTDFFTGGGLSMVQKRGVSMVQLSDLRQLFFGKGVSRWYNEIFEKNFFGVYDGFFKGKQFCAEVGAEDARYRPNFFWR